MSKIDEIKARLEKATPGPWKWWTSNSWKRLKRDDHGIAQNVAEPYVCRDGHPDLSISDEDMALIAHAPSDLAYLLGEVEHFQSWGKYAADTIEALKERAEKAELALAEATRWQPIETAPKDGKRALLLDRWGNQEIGRWIGSPHNHWSVDGFRSVDRPTHWKPLPTPPEPETP